MNNYCIGRYWNGKDGPISVYAYGTQVHWGDNGDAEELLRYAREATGQDDWQVFTVVPQAAVDELMAKLKALKAYIARDNTP
jgi:hypothetical protein